MMVGKSKDPIMIIVTIATLSFLQVVFASEKNSCAAYAYDACTCLSADYNCRFLTNGLGCVDKDLACRKLRFDNDECRKESTIYTVGGALCFYDGPSGGKCKTPKSHEMVLEPEDSIEDLEYDAGGIEEVANLLPLMSGLLDLAEDGDTVKDDNEVDIKDNTKRLAPSSARKFRTVGGKTKQSMCEMYMLPAKESGNYEITLTTHDYYTTVKKPGQGTLNVEINHDVAIIKELDLYQFAQKDIHINYKIVSSRTSGKKTLKLQGHADRIFFGDELPLQFCPGSCKFGGEEADETVVDFFVRSIAVTQHTKEENEDEEESTGLQDLSESDEHGNQKARVLVRRKRNGLGRTIEGAMGGGNMTTPGPPKKGKKDDKKDKKGKKGKKEEEEESEEKSEESGSSSKEKKKGKKDKKDKKDKDDKDKEKDKDSESEEDKKGKKGKGKKKGHKKDKKKDKKGKDSDESGDATDMMKGGSTSPKPLVKVG